jgi:endonuclease/exonuclease/phosphatase family metal-dependent hydrolase
VMSYNIEFHSAGEPRTLEAIGAQQADVVAMQEVTFDMQPLIQARYADLYPYQLYQASTGTSGLGVLSRYPLTDDGIHPGPHGWHPAWHVRVDIPGVPVELLNVHLRSWATGQHGLRSILDTPDDHLAEIEGFSSECPGNISSLVLGDFNEGTSGEAVTYLEQNGFENVLPQFHPGQPTWRYRSVGDQLELSVDHILYDDTLRPLNSWVEVEGRSDHLPVLAHFEARTW